LGEAKKNEPKKRKRRCPGCRETMFFLAMPASLLTAIDLSFGCWIIVWIYTLDLVFPFFLL
jgi:hypothetical protein